MAEAATDDNVRNKTIDNKRKNNPYRRSSKPSSDYIVRRRKPPHATKRKNDIYVTSSSNFKEYLSRCMKLIDDGESEIIIHGLGAAIPVAINLALQLEERLCETFMVAANTDTVDCVDDIEPLADELEGDNRNRSTSCIRIKLCNKNNSNKNDALQT